MVDDGGSRRPVLDFHGAEESGVVVKPHGLCNRSLPSFVNILAVFIGLAASAVPLQMLSYGTAQILRRDE